MDRAVQKTDDDAASSKYSAMSKGYFEDNYLALFCSRAPPPPRLPLINIGTYCRVQGVELLVRQFLKDTEAAPRSAIVSLGAGSDTRPFHVLPAHANVEYHELDFGARTAKKAQKIRTNEVLSQALGLDAAPQSVESPFVEPQSAAVQSAAAPPLSAGEIHTNAYHLYGVDLRTLGKPGAVTPRALQALFAEQVPTLLLSECCLCYMSPEDSDGVLRFFAQHIPSPLLSLAMYEPMALNDEFGRVMAQNLAMRGLSLPTFRLYNTLEAQRARIARIIGAREVGAVNVETVYDDWLDPADQARVSRLEFLDEVEEMRLLMRHYCIAWARGGPH